MLAALLGYAAHRASLCAVKAVAELMTGGSAWLPASLAKTVLWATAVTLPVLWLCPERGMAVGGFALEAGALVGGFVFGVLLLLWRVTGRTLRVSCHRDLCDYQEH